MAQLYYGDTPLSQMPSSYPASRVTLSDGQSVQNALYLSGLRFKNLGNSFTAEQATALANGDLSDFWNGDYWTDTSQNIIWRIVDNTDYMLHKGDTEFTAHGLIVMPDSPLIVADGVTHLMNDTNTTAGGYNGTKYRSTYRTQCKTKVTNFFGATHCASHREQLSTDVSSGKASNWNWQDCDVELPSEVNIYGHVAWSCYTDGGSAYNIGSEWGQFRLFSLAPYMAINRNANSWLRDVVSSQKFSAIQGMGIANAFDAGNEWVGFRPFFVLV